VLRPFYFSGTHWPSTVAELLSRELGGDRVLRAPEALEPYGARQSGRGVFRPTRPCCASRARRSSSCCASRPSTGSGHAARHGHGHDGRRAAGARGLVLSTERMKKIVDISVDDRIAIVEPGVINADLQAAVEAQSMFYAPDPASLAMCSMGGKRRRERGGPRAFKYGVTRDWTLGLVVTLMAGETLRLGPKTPKGVTGYDLTALFVAARETSA